MGIFHVPVGVGDPDGAQFESVEALVDTGATFTILPGSMLRRLGVEPQRSGSFELADGSLRTYSVAETYLQVEGEEVHCPVVFGDDGMQPILGAVTLEILGFAVDPARKRLLRVPWRLL